MGGSIVCTWVPRICEKIYDKRALAALGRTTVLAAYVGNAVSSRVIVVVDILPVFIIATAINYKLVRLVYCLFGRVDCHCLWYTKLGSCKLGLSRLVPGYG